MSTRSHSIRLRHNMHFECECLGYIPTAIRTRCDNTVESGVECYEFTGESAAYGLSEEFVLYWRYGFQEDTEMSGAELYVADRVWDFDGQYGIEMCVLFFGGGNWY